MANPRPRRPIGKHPWRRATDKLVGEVRRKAPTFLEDGEAMALMSWAGIMLFRGRPLSDYLVHIPNGGKRDPREARRLKRMGVRPGFPDYFLHVPMQEAGTNRFIAGLVLELKAQRIAGRHLAGTSTEQLEQLSFLTLCGYRTERAYGWVEAAVRICEYLGIDPRGLPCNSRV